MNQDKLIGTGYDEGYANWSPAEVYVEYLDPKPDEIYETYSSHGVADIYNGDRIVLGNSRHAIRFTAPDRCQPGQSFAPNGDACPTPSPSPSPSPDSTPDTRFQVFIDSLNFVRPAGTTGGENTSFVRVRTEPAQPGKTVNLRLEGHENSGGHIDAHHTRNANGTSGRPLGRLRTMSGTTNNSGTFETTYTPSHIAGKIKIIATIDNINVANDMFISVPDLRQLGTDDIYYDLVGATVAHPADTNHWGTFDANIGLINIAIDYKNTYYPNRDIPAGEKIAYNDQSLPFGGKFEINASWSNTVSHQEHRQGINCDVRSNNIPNSGMEGSSTKRWKPLNDIFVFRGSTDTFDETINHRTGLANTRNPHWHLRFEFGLNLPNAPVASNASSFVEQAFWSPLDREANQIEWQDWMNRIEYAQTQGFAVTLSEAKVLERTLFQSTEYINRNRSDEDYISDLYAGYLRREPDFDGYNARLNALRNANSNGQNGREQVLRMFEEDQEFANIVAGIEGTAATVPGCDPIQEQDCYNNNGLWDSGSCSCTYQTDPCYQDGYYYCD